MSKNVMKMVAGLDIGNGCVKGSISTDGREKANIDYKSSVAIETHTIGVKAKGADIGEDISDIFNNMNASFDTPAVMSHANRLFGQRGVNSGNAVEEFDVVSVLSKVQQDLSGILLLGSLAGHALQVYYHDNGKLPAETIHVDACIAVALPVTEYKVLRKQYVDKFRGILHMVSIHNFETPVRVEIMITDMAVMAEGASAQYAINEAGEGLMNIMLKDVRDHGVALEGITAADMLSAQNTVGVDIGEGTVNFPVFQNGRFNPEASRTFNKGFGTVLEATRENLRLNNTGLTFTSRKALLDFVMSEPRPLTKARHDRVMMALNEEIESFVAELIMNFRGVLGRIGSSVDVAYVYGGGAMYVKDQLYPALLNTVMSGGDDMSLAFPVLYLDARYSRHLNKEGLFLVAQELASNKA